MNDISYSVMMKIFHKGNKSEKAIEYFKEACNLGFKTTGLFNEALKIKSMLKLSPEYQKKGHFLTSFIRPHSLYA